MYFFSVVFVVIVVLTSLTSGLEILKGESIIHYMIRRSPNPLVHFSGDINNIGISFAFLPKIYKLQFKEVLYFYMLFVSYHI